MQRRILSIVLLTCLVLSLVLGSKPQKASAALGSSDFLKTNGIWLKNNSGTGSVVTLHGTNLGSWLQEENWMAPLGEVWFNRSGWGAAASSTESGGSPYNALDGNINTRWSSGAAQTNGQWFQVDMGSQQTFDQITMDAGPNTGDYPASYIVQVSSDNANWTQVASGNGNGQLTTVNFDPHTARYIKVTQTGSKGNWWSIAEFNVYVTDEWTERGNLTNRFGQATADNIYATFQDTWIQASDLDNIKNMGLNFVRVPIYWENIMNRDGTMKPDSVAFRKLDWVVSQAQQRGIYVLLDLHGVPGGGSNGWQSGGRSGSNDFWWNTTYQNWVTQIWQRLAAHYKGNPAVAGYDLMNEPVSSNSNLSISQEYNTLYQAVRAVDPDHIIVVEAFGYWNNIVSPSTYGWQNVVYQVHNYNWSPNDYNSQSNSINQWLSDIQTYQANWNVPVYAGEFTLWGYNDLWVKYLSGLDALSVNWTNWAYKNRESANAVDWNGLPDGGNWGLYNTCNAPFPDFNNDSSTTIQNDLSQWGTSNCQANTMLQNIVKTFATLPTTSSLTAMANNNYVSADNAGANPLIANRTSVGTWEKYVIVQNPDDGTYSFLSMANWRWVTANLNTTNTPLVAKAVGIAQWERFKKVTNADGTVSFQSMANNNYVSTDLNSGSPTLYADRASIGGAWEKYVINPAP